MLRMIGNWFRLIFHCTKNWHDMGWIAPENCTYTIVFCAVCRPELKAELDEIIKEGETLEQEG